MCRKVARLIAFFVVLLMSLEIIGASVSALPATSGHAFSIVSEKQSPSLFGNLFFEKAEEESEKDEKERDGTPRVVLIDFSRVAFSLSFYYTPLVQLAVPECRYDVRPPLHQLHCLFLI